MLARTNTWQVADKGISVSIPQQSISGRTGSKLKILFLSIPVIALLAMPYFASIAAEQKGYEVQQVRARVVQLTKENEALRLEVGQLKAPGRIQQIAETELGMFIPTDVLYSSASAKRVAVGGNMATGSIRD